MCVGLAAVFCALRVGDGLSVEVVGTATFAVLPRGAPRRLRACGRSVALNWNATRHARFWREHFDGNRWEQDTMQAARYVAPDLVLDIGAWVGPFTRCPVLFTG